MMGGQDGLTDDWGATAVPTPSPPATRAAFDIRGYPVDVDGEMVATVEIYAVPRPAGRRREPPTRTPSRATSLLAAVLAAALALLISVLVSRRITRAARGAHRRRG